MQWYKHLHEHTMCISKFNFYFHSSLRSRKTNCMNLYPCISVFRICTKQTVTSKWLFKRFYIFEVISGHRPFIHSIFIPEFQIEKGETQPDKKVIIFTFNVSLKKVYILRTNNIDFRCILIVTPR